MVDVRMNAATTCMSLKQTTFHNNIECMEAQTQTPLSRFRLATSRRFLFLLVHFDIEKLPHEVGSHQLLRSCLQHQTLSDVDSALRSEFMSSLRALLLSGRTVPRISRIHASCATTVSSSTRRGNTFSHLSPFFCVVFFDSCSSSLDGR